MTKKVSIKRTKKPAGLILYDGPSMLNGDHVVAVISLSISDNRKTGNLIQSWILHADMTPFEANFSNADKSVCGVCRHRTFRTCYVNKCHGPLAVFNAYKRGSYKHLNNKNISYLKNKKIRLGAYGDPAAIPFEVWSLLLKDTKVSVGYTHQWKTCDSRFKNLCMASCDTPDEALKAQGMGWRTFRTVAPKEKLLPNEFSCPASAEKGKKTTCEKCLACGGMSSAIKKNPVIVAHGVSCGRFNEIMKRIRNHEKYTDLVPTNTQSVKPKIISKIAPNVVPVAPVAMDYAY